MSPNNLQSCPNHRKAAAEELIKGREFAIQLQALLHETSPVDQEQTSIMKEVIAAISRALRALDCRAKTEEELLHDDGDDENASKKIKIESTQRGGYRRRYHPFASATTRSNSLDDGHAWRKYGQKEIYSSKFPRSYFRCTHKYDQDCKATRQVQRSEEDPSLFVITYFGEHSCRDHPMEVQSSSCFQAEEASRIIDFASHAKTAAAAAAASYQRPELLPPKQDCCEEVVSSNLSPTLIPTPTPTPTPESSSDCFEFPDLGALEGSVQIVDEFAGVVSEHSDISSGFDQSSGENWGWDFMDVSFYIRDMLNFEHDVLL